MWKVESGENRKGVQRIESVLGSSKTGGILRKRCIGKVLLA